MVSDELKPLTMSIGQLRSFDIVADVDTPLYGTLEDWPPNIQDAIYKLIEDKKQELRIGLMVVASESSVVPGGNAYVRVAIVEDRRN